jgi:thiamine-phosphate pyrophosphorylase
MRGFYFITDSGLCTKTDVEAVEEAVEGGAFMVQYREKGLPRDQLVETAGRLRDICRGKAVFIVNDYVDVAREVDADGVHLGQDDAGVKEARVMLGPGKIIGVTVHDVVEAVVAQSLGADYVGVSPIFATATKADAGEPAGVGLIRDIKARLKIPVAAIGGINEDNIDSVVEAGADMACAVSATVTREDIRGAVKYFADKWTR